MPKDPHVMLNPETGNLLRNELVSVGTALTNELTVTTMAQIAGELNHQQQQQQQQNDSCFVENRVASTHTGNNSSDSELHSHFVVAVAGAERGPSLEATDVNFHQIFTTIEEEGASDPVRTIGMVGEGCSLSKRSNAIAFPLKFYFRIPLLCKSLQ